ncbi:MAG: class I SAM-dependent methyltransferase [Planctomycetota bacterium]
MSSTSNFSRERAKHYDQQGQVVLAGHEALYSLTADLMSVVLPESANILVVGVGTGYELGVIADRLPSSNLVGIDPAESMVDVARGRVREAGLDSQVELKVGHLGDHDLGRRFDAAVMLGVLHHVQGEGPRKALVQAVADHVKPSGHLLLACQCGSWAEHPEFVEVMNRSVSSSELDVEAKSSLLDLMKSAQTDMILPSEKQVFGFLSEAGFCPPQRYFQSLLFTAWWSRRETGV